MEAGVIETRVCTACSVEKPLDDFYTYLDARRGKTRCRAKCKPCENAQSRAYGAANVESIAANKSAYWRKNKELLSAKGREARYGITAEQFDELLARQRNLCAICGGRDPGRGKGWNVDHDHTTGVVRGILCHHCNTALGGFKDDPTILANAIAYLETSGTWRT